jgi:prevent-host-death family protein
MIVNIHAAKTNLSKLIARAQAGEEVVIANAGQPVARLLPLPATQTQVGGVPETLPSWMGSLRGRVWISPDIDAVERELAEQMEHGATFADGAPEG